MFAFILVWISCFYGPNPPPLTVWHVSNSVRIYGSCYNAGTKKELRVRVSALFRKSRLSLGESNEAGIFDFRIPDSTKYLSFEREGFRTTTVPVRFLGPIASHSEFRIGVPMSAKEAQPVQPFNELVLCFTVPDSLDIDYEITQPIISAHYTYFEFKRRKHPHNFLIRDFRPGKYLFAASTPGGRSLLREEITTGSGLNFKAVYIDGAKESTVSNPIKPVVGNMTKAPDTRALYFDQSSYELKQETKAALDSIALFLIGQPNLVAHMTGYTDNVGQRGLNVILSEYRARMVAGYLRQKGVASHRLVTTGKGPDALVVSNDSEEAKSRSRRVVIQLLRR